jgi:Initiator Replication protein
LKWSKTNRGTTAQFGSTIARHTLTPREHKLVLYVMSMIQPEDEAFKLYRINVADSAAIAGLDNDHLYEELREVAVGLKSKPLVIEGHYEAGDF